MTRSLEIAVQPACNAWTKWNEPILGEFCAVDSQDLSLQVHVTPLEPTNLTNAKPEGLHQREHEVIALSPDQDPLLDQATPLHDQADRSSAVR